MFQFLKNDRVISNKLLDDSVNYLVKKYKQSREMFSFSTAYGQIQLVLHNLTQVNLFYNQDSITQLNFDTANRKSSIYGNSRLAGHNPYRGKSATGEVSLSLKQSGLSQINGQIIYLPNYTRIKCQNNQLEYIINLGINNDDITLDLKNLDKTRLVINEGKLDYQLFQGDGKDLQSVVVNVPKGSMIDNDFLIVTVSNNIFKTYDSFYDIPFGVAGCLAKTSFSNGIDVFFFTETNSVIPKLGEQIRVDYLTTNGSIGNIYDTTGLSFNFIDTGIDINGNEVNLDSLFDIKVELPPDFGSDSENPEMTKLLSTFTPRNIILHDEQSIKYFFMKMNYFSNVRIVKNITDVSNVFDSYLYPNVKNRLVSNEDYFSIDNSKFLLSTIEKTRLLNSIEASGNKSSNIDINIVDPKEKKFAVVVICDVFEKINGNVTKSTDVIRNIRIVLSDYMLNNNRMNIVPNSDIITKIDNISAIDKVKIVFIPEDQTMLDNMGNISLKDTEIAVMRGGFIVNGLTYFDEFNPNGHMGAVNIQLTFIKNTI